MFPILISLGTVLQIQAQETLSSQTTLTSKPSKTETRRPVDSQPKRLIVESARITYGGVIHDLTKAKKSTSILGRAKAPKSKDDLENVYRDPASQKPKGFVLFAIRF